MKPIQTCAKWLAVVVATTGAVAAHHSPAMYAMDKQLVLDGTIAALHWTNPHVMIDFISKGSDDQPARNWTVEASSPGVLTRAGWSKRSLVAGDRVQVQLAPLRDGRPGSGAMLKITKLDSGEVLTWTFSAEEK